MTTLSADLSLLCVATQLVNPAQHHPPITYRGGAMSKHSVPALTAVAVASSLFTLLATEVVRPSNLIGQQGAASGLTMFAYHRKDTDKDQGFIFYDAKTGDIWVYDNENVKEHYKVGPMGQNLTKLK
jgi:hypothetical protein